MRASHTSLVALAVLFSALARGEDSPLDRLTRDAIPRELLPKDAPPELVGVLAGHTRTIGALVFVPSGDTLVSAEIGGPKKGDPAGSIRIWDLAGHRPRLKTELRGHGDWIYSLALSPDGKTLASGGVRHDQAIRFWDLARDDPAEVAILDDFTYWWHGSLAFSPDGLWLATTSGPQAPLKEVQRAAIAGEPLRDVEPVGPVQLWKVNREGSGEIRISKGLVLKGPAWAVAALTYSTDGKTLAAILSSGRGDAKDGRLLIWDVEADRLARGDAEGAKLRADVEIDALRNRRPSDTVYDLEISQDGRWLAAASGGGQVLLWDLTKAQPDQPELNQAHAGHAQSVAFLPDNRLLSSGSDGRVLLHDLKRRGLDHQWYFGGDSLKLALAPDGRHAGIGTAGGTIYILRVSGLQ